MSIKPKAVKAGRRTPTNEKAPGAGGAKGHKKISQRLNSTVTRGKATKDATSLANMAAPPLSVRLYELLLRGVSVADAPTDSLISHPGVLSWHEVAGGVGRLSDHVRVVRASLRATGARQAILSDRIAVQALDRVQVVNRYWLAQLVAVADLRQMALFQDGQGEQS